MPQGKNKTNQKWYKYISERKQVRHPPKKGMGFELLAGFSVEEPSSLIQWVPRFKSTRVKSIRELKAATSARPPH